MTDIYDNDDCFLCWNRGCSICCPCKDEPMPERDFGIDPFEGEPAGWSDDEIEQHARDTHELVLAGKLPFNAVYGEDGFDPFSN